MYRSWAYRVFSCKCPFRCRNSSHCMPDTMLSALIHLVRRVVGVLPISQMGKLRRTSPWAFLLCQVPRAHPRRDPTCPLPSPDPPQPHWPLFPPHGFTLQPRDPYFLPPVASTLPLLASALPSGQLQESSPSPVCPAPHACKPFFWCPPICPI